MMCGFNAVCALPLPTQVWGEKTGTRVREKASIRPYTAAMKKYAIWHL